MSGEGNMLEPTLHKPVPMDTRVVIPAGYCSLAAVQGTVVGISCLHVIFGYIVLLDEAITTDYGEQRAVIVYGSQIETPDGRNFRLDR